MARRPLAYIDRWSFDPGEHVTVRASGHGRCSASLIRLRGLEGTGLPTGYRADPPLFAKALDLFEQPIVRGSWAQTEAGPRVDSDENWCWSLVVRPTLVDAGILLDWGNGAVRLAVADNRIEASLAGDTASLPIISDSWSRIELSFERGSGRLRIVPLSHDAWHRRPESQAFAAHAVPIDGRLVIGRGFNGKIEAPTLTIDGSVEAAWSFADDIPRQSVPGSGPRASRLQLVGAPRRAVTASAWDGTAHDWTVKPSHYGAIHVHDDDLDDCGWQASEEIQLPPDAPSGVYAIRLDDGTSVHHVPLFLRPQRSPPVVFLASTFSYLAYGNSLWASPSAAEIAADFPEETAAMQSCGLSTYSRHRDGSGIGLVSLRRPLLNASPGFLGEAIGGQALINDDLRILAWLDRTEPRYAVITDHDLHERGAHAFVGTRVVVTGVHPEYHSRESLNALDDFANAGGRILYLGGNGFYWRIAPLPEAPHVIELRRAENGIRIWAEPPGEYVHQADGLRGGTWRQLGRPPNRLVGVGFSAQGDMTPTRPYVRTAAADDPRAAFLFEGVTSHVIGEEGPTGAAGGYELDRADVRLDTPPHALVVARTAPFESGLAPVNEERLTHTLIDADDPLRADLTFFEGPNGGAVLATGSILFAGCLDEEQGAGRLAANALHRFTDPAPFVLPEPL